MILDGVDVFVKVVQAGGFSSAARLLGMPTTTVSAKIARLEERLGTTLIQRSTRRMHVTEAGKAYFDHCVEAIRVLEAGEEQLAAASAEPSGLLRITAPSDMAQSILPTIVSSYLETYPRARVELVVTNVPLNLLAEGIDLAIRASPIKDSTLTSRKFGSGPLALFASPAYLQRRGVPGTPADLADHELMVHPSIGRNGLPMNSGDESFVLAGSSRLKADDMATLRAFAQRGFGIALLPDFGDATASGLERVLPGFATMVGTVYFLYPAQRFVPANVRAFIDLAVSMSSDELC